MPESSPAIRPFLKWAGNKYRLIDRIRRRLPIGKRLVEPFAGAAAVFLNTDYPRYLLADQNRDLIDLYTILKHEGGDFIEDCRRLFVAENNTAEAYYALRARFNQCHEPRGRALLFVYLNRHGYNGLCRYNASGGFNVPFGRYKKPYFPANEMLAFHHKAKRATFRHACFQDTLRHLRQGDVVYCDPPYVPLSASSNFTSYAAGSFSLEQQQQLATLVASAAQKGNNILVSNHDTPLTRDMYADAHMEQFSVRRTISCQGHKRGAVSELLVFYPARKQRAKQ